MELLEWKVDKKSTKISFLIDSIELQSHVLFLGKLFRTLFCRTIFLQEDLYLQEHSITWELQGIFKFYQSHFEIGIHCNIKTNILCQYRNSSFISLPVCNIQHRKHNNNNSSTIVFLLTGSLYVYNVKRCLLESW